MKKKILAGILAGCMMLGICACNKNTDSRRDTDKKDRTDTEDVVDEEDEEEVTDKPAKETEVTSTYLIDVSDKEGLKTLIDAVIASEPCKGECNEDVRDKLNASLAAVVDSYGYYGNHIQMYFEYDHCIANEYEGMDHVDYVGYDGYETEEIDREDYIVSYETVYAHQERPGLATVMIYIYDKDRALECWHNISDHLVEMFPDGTIDDTWGEDRFVVSYGEGFLDIYGMISIKEISDGCWAVCAEITLANPDLLVENPESEAETESDIDVEAEVETEETLEESVED